LSQSADTFEDVRGALASWIVVSVCACDAVIGLGEYKFGDGGSMEGGGGDVTPPGDSGTCNVDLTKECYPCQPTSNEQFLNSCSNGAVCTGFQDLKGLLLPDGGLPPLPPLDAGGD
jgi:hypothetical protein